jgi:hypothetical protein
MNIFVEFGNTAIIQKNMKKTLHHALCAMIHFLVILGGGEGGGGDTPSPNNTNKVIS